MSTDKNKKVKRKIKIPIRFWDPLKAKFYIDWEASEFIQALAVVERYLAKTQKPRKRKRKSNKK